MIFLSGNLYHCVTLLPQKKKINSKDHIVQRVPYFSNYHIYQQIKYILFTFTFFSCLHTVIGNVLSETEDIMEYFFPQRPKQILGQLQFSTTSPFTGTIAVWVLAVPWIRTVRKCGGCHFLSELKVAKSLVPARLKKSVKQPRPWVPSLKLVLHKSKKEWGKTGMKYCHQVKKGCTWKK